MKSRRIFLAIAAVLIVLAGWFAWRSGPPPAGGASISPQTSASPSATPPETTQALPPAGGPAAPHPPAPAAPVQPALTRNTSPASNIPVSAEQAAAPWSGSISRAEAMVELDKVHHMIASYHTLMGQNPVGTNAEIMKALMGGNPRQAILGPPPGQSLDGKGELLDPWGTPYFFHQLSADDMEIHSAGPDRIMGTPDDLVIP